MAATSSAAPAMAGSASVSSRPVRKRFATSRAPAALVAQGHPTVAEVDARRPQLVSLALEGMTVEAAAETTGLTPEAVKRWLNHRGYRWGDGVIRSRVACVRQVEADIAARIAAAPPSAPCYRCGAARGCEHR